MVGQGRLARPRFRFSGAVAIGYDDNIFSTPTKQQEFPDQTVEVLVRPAQPAQTVTVQDGTETVFLGGIEQTVPKFRTVTIPGTPAETGKVTIPGSKTEPREASLVERANIGLEVQFASRRTLLTLDLRLGAERTEARDKDPLQYNGSLGFRFAHKLAPRLQWNSSVDAVYSSQPDLSRINTPTTVTSGSYLDLVARTGLEYRWTPRIATSASITYHTLTFSDTSEQSGDYNDVTLSVEGRYLFSPRLKLVAEGRYSQIGYDNDFARDSHTSFALLGADLAWSRRTNSSLRAGVAIRDSELGETAYSPYLEFNLSYRLGQTSALQWNTRYGFEEPGDSTSKVLTLRNGLSYIQYFTPRLRAVAGGNIVYSTTTETTTDDSTTQLAFDTNLGFEYNINRRWSFTGTYSFTTVFSDNEFADYYRNRLFLGFEYTF